MMRTKMSLGIGGHQRAYEGKNDEWLTPPYIIESLGEFDLDPCSPIKRPWNTAKNHYTKEDNGLKKDWLGRVWLNPPYGQETGKWLNKLVIHGNGIALIFARTETEMFHKYVWDKADALLFLKGRLFFHYVNGNRAYSNSGAPSVLVAYGKENTESLYSSKIEGKIVILK